MISIQRINNEIVKPIKYVEKIKDKRPLKGEKIFQEMYPNVFLVAKKKSGKTFTCAKILESCATKETTIYAFVSTIYKDRAWKGIKKRMEKLRIPFIGATSMYEDKKHRLKEWMNAQENELDEDSDEEYENEQQPIALFDDDDDDNNMTIKRAKYKAPKFIFVFDDISHELKDPVLTAFLKKNRHFQAMTIISTQHIHDAPPGLLKQVDNWIVFKGLQDEKLKKIQKDGDLTLDFDEFKALYDFATQKLYSFLYIDTNFDEYRRNFNDKLFLQSAERQTDLF